jgi:hypothetical protein
MRRRGGAQKQRLGDALEEEGRDGSGAGAEE